MSEIEQVHLRAVMLFMSEMSEIIIIFNIHSIWWYGWKALSLSFSKLFQIENPLSIKEVMSQNVCVCSFAIFNIHSIPALRCFWSIFDTFNIHNITALRCIWSIFDIFDIDSITFKRYHIKKVMTKMCLYVLFPSSTSSTYIALQPLGVFDLSSTSST